MSGRCGREDANHRLWETGRKRDGRAGYFDFLGFTHYCGASRSGRFRVKRKTSKKKYQASLHKCQEWLRRNRHIKGAELIGRLRLKLVGYYRYYGITDNFQMLRRFRYEVDKSLHKWLNRRSQRKSLTWEEYNQYIAKLLLCRKSM